MFVILIQQYIKSNKDAKNRRGILPFFLSDHFKNILYASITFFGSRLDSCFSISASSGK